MSMAFSTGEVPAESRSRYWEEVVDDTLLPLRGRHAPDFAAELIVGDIGAVRVAEATTPAGECYRTPKLISSGNNDLYETDVVVSGHVQVEQSGRRARLGPGDIAFVDPALPVRYLTSATTHVAVLFPRSMLPLRADEAARLTGLRVPGDRGAGALASSLARQLPRHLDDLDTTEAVSLGGRVVDLLGTAFAARLGGDRQTSSNRGQQALLQQIYLFVDAHLGDLDLTPTRIAAEHHISVRYLHKLFHGQNDTVAGWIRQRRLDRCRRDLIDPAAQAQRIGAIAARWGLPDATHFSRIFKAAYGVSPAEYRWLHFPGGASTPKPRHRADAA